MLVYSQKSCISTETSAFNRAKLGLRPSPTSSGATTGVPARAVQHFVRAVGM